LKNTVINVVCVLRQGGKVGYDPTWVTKLHNAITKNLTVPHQFLCLSDCDVDCERIPLDSTGPGFWAKLQLFKPGVIQGPVLYLDLDTVICQNIDDIVTQCLDKDFVMWHEVDKDIHSSAMMWWQGDQSHLWEIYQSSPIEHWQSLYSKAPLYGDQALISENVKHDLFTDFLPSEWIQIASSRHHNNLDQIKILHFRKTSQKPSTMLDHPLVKEHWV